MDAKSRRRVLYDYLDRNNCTVQKGSEFTHTSIYDPSGTYYISPEKTPKFIQLYKDTVRAGEELYFTEKHKDIGPIVIDLDFRFPYNGKDVVRMYAKTDIERVIKLYTNAYTDFLDEDEEEGTIHDGTFKVYVMEKPNAILHKGLIKDGVHIVIPDIVTRPVFQLMMRERLLEPINSALTNIGLSNPIADVVDEAVIERNNWQMVGSKKPHLDKYAVTHVYSFSVKDRELVEDVECLVDAGQSDFVEVLSIRNKFVETKIKFERADDLKKYEELVEARKMRIHFKNSIMSKTRNVKTNKVETEDEYKRICALVDLLSVERAESYNDWIRVGWCLRNIDCRLVEKWVSFSQKSRKFVAGECERQ